MKGHLTAGSDTRHHVIGIQQTSPRRVLRIHGREMRYFAGLLVDGYATISSIVQAGKAPGSHHLNVKIDGNVTRSRAPF